MKATGFAIVLFALLALRPAAGQNLVVNGDFEGGFTPETHLGFGYRVANGWSWCQFTAGSDPSDGRAYQGIGLGMDGSNCQRLRIVQNRTAESVMWQTINTVPGKRYTVQGNWRIAPAGCSGEDCVGNWLLPWIGVIFVDGGTGEFFSDWDIVSSIVPRVGYNDPFRMQFPYNPPYIPTELIIPLNRDIVAEHAYNFFLLPEAGYQLDYWESFYDAAGGAGDPSMPGIGESAANGGGAAWQTKVAAGDHMIVGFFILDAPSTTGDGTDLYIDNVSVTEGPYGCPLDLDNDGDVDQDDLTVFLSCGSGPEVPHDGTTLCQRADFDFDFDVDLSDFARLQRCYSGEGPVGSDCCP